MRFQDQAWYSGHKTPKLLHNSPVLLPYSLHQSGNKTLFLESYKYNIPFLFELFFPSQSISPSHFIERRHRHTYKRRLKDCKKGGVKILKNSQKFSNTSPTFFFKHLYTLIKNLRFTLQVIIKLPFDPLPQLPYNRPLSYPITCYKKAFDPLTQPLLTQSLLSQSSNWTSLRKVQRTPIFHQRKGLHLHSI